MADSAIGRITDTSSGSSLNSSLAGPFHYPTLAKGTIQMWSRSPYFRSQSRASFIICQKCVRGLSLSAISGRGRGRPETTDARDPLFCHHNSAIHSWTLWDTHFPLHIPQAGRRPRMREIKCTAWVRERNLSWVTWAGRPPANEMIKESAH